jgi:hypothetical protein
VNGETGQLYGVAVQPQAAPQANRVPTREDIKRMVAENPGRIEEIKALAKQLGY